LTGCWTPKQMSDDKVADVVKEVVKIGVIAPLSGPGATYGEDAVNVFQQSVDEYNASNPTTKVTLIVEDGKCAGKDATSAAQKLVNVDKIDILLGGQCSSETLGWWLITSNAKVVALSPVSSSPEITNMWPYIFRFWNDTFSSIVLWEYTSKKLGKIGMFVENTDYAVGLAKVFVENYKGEVVFEEKFNTDEKDFGILAKKASNNSIDGIVLITQTETTSATAIIAFQKEGLLDTFKGNILGGFFFSSEKFAETAGDLRDWLIEVQLAGVEHAGEKGINYIASYKESYEVKSADTFVLLDKEGIDLVLDAIKAGNRDSESLKKYFETITKENPRDGYFGEYYFDENGDALWLKYVMHQYQSGEWKEIE